MDYLLHYLPQDYVETGLGAAQLFLACAVVVLAGYRVWDYLEARFGWARAAKAPEIVLDGAVRRQPGTLALSDWKAAPDLAPTALDRVDKAQSLHALALQQTESTEYLLLQLRRDLDGALGKSSQDKKSEAPASPAAQPVPLAA